MSDKKQTSTRATMIRPLDEIHVDGRWVEVQGIERDVDQVTFIYFDRDGFEQSVSVLAGDFLATRE